MHATPEMELMLKGYGLTTAEILYRMPDHLNFLQTYVWQEYDIAPKFPVLFNFSNSGSRSWTDRCILSATRIGA